LMPEEASRDNITIAIKRTQFIDSIEEATEPNIYYISRSDIYPDLDALVLDNNEDVFAIQPTISDTHPVVVEPLKNLLNHYPGKVFNLIFVLPPEVFDQFKKQPFEWTISKKEKPTLEKTLERYTKDELESYAASHIITINKKQCNNHRGGVYHYSSTTPHY